MDRGGRPAWGWRLLAWWTFVVVGLFSLPGLPATGGWGWLLAASNYVAIAGTFSYAYARAPRPLWFWRVFASIFSLYTMASLGPLLHAFVSAAWTAPEQLSWRDWSVSTLTLVLCFLICIALLRHAQLLQGRQRSAMRDLEGVFA